MKDINRKEKSIRSSNRRSLELFAKLTTNDTF